ncbi:hypothetical protein HNR46_000367 [Haloferula luteola]|uniref:Porin n=1 Tax=Haloferula luteola TaxID=595692 RepID=A0A840UZ92_9BACT|nr:porin [Haloferula luteola]MBB5350146.1 hypothetical protein [Haloferula luteola]
MKLPDRSGPPFPNPRALHRPLRRNLTPATRLTTQVVLTQLRLPKAVAILLLGGTSTLQAYDFLGSPTTEETAEFNRFWRGWILYQNGENSILQEFKLRGRYQGQYYDVDARQGSDSDWEDRRSRWGFDALLFDSRLEARFDVQSNDGFRDLYDGLVDAYLRWHASESLTVTLGRTKPFIGYYDWLQSSNSQPTFERSQIFNQLQVDRATGFTIESTYHDWSWQAGVFSNSVDPDRNSFTSAFGEFNASWSLSLGLGYDFSESTRLDRAELHLNALHNERDADSNLLTRYQDIVSATWWVQNGRWSAVAEGYWATGGEGSDGDVLGAFLQGTYDLIPKRLQLVGRYSFALGDGIASVRGQRRYEATVSAATGDTYQAVYLGAQYFIHGDKLKLMGGGEFASLQGGATGRDVSGFTWLSGLRFSF